MNLLNTVKGIQENKSRAQYYKSQLFTGKPASWAWAWGSVVPAYWLGGHKGTDLEEGKCYFVLKYTWLCYR